MPALARRGLCLATIDVPFIERDPWRLQYFTGVECPATVVIPTDDEHAWVLHPLHRWIYDKLRVSETQGFTAAPHGVLPPSFPVFSKPIYNLQGMGAGSRLMATREELVHHETPGHFWMPVLYGEHVSTDVAVVGGDPRWWRHTTGAPLADGCFDHWTVEAAARPTLERYCGDWLRRHLHGYTGAVNLETIGGRIIEVHLRFADQWPDLYGDGWLEAIVRLYRDGVWRYDEPARRPGVSLVLFGPHGRHYMAPSAATVDAWAQTPGVTSVQITFHPGLASDRHVMPPGGFRLAVINCWDVDAGLQVRDALAAHFGVEAPAHDHRRSGQRICA